MSKTKSSLIKILLISGIAFLVFACVSFSLITKKANTVFGDTEMTVNSLGGGIQDNNSRYIINLVCDVEYNSSQGGSWKGTINGAEKNIEFYADTTAKQIGLVIPYSDAPKTQRNVIVIKQGSMSCGYTIKEDTTIITNGNSFYLEKDEVDWQITSVGGGIQDDFDRYIIRLNGSSSFDTTEDNLGSWTVEVNGVDVSIALYNDKGNKQLCLLIPYSIASKTVANAIVVKGGSTADRYVVNQDTVIMTKGNSVFLKSDIRELSLSLVENDENKISASQANLSRYLFYLQTDVSGIKDTMWDGNLCVLDKGTKDEKKVTIYFVGGTTSDTTSESYDGTQILAVLYFSDIIYGATSVTEIGKHSITIENGTILGGGYSVKQDFTFYIANENIATIESELPEIPNGVFANRKRKTVDYTTQKIEDYIAEASVVKLKADAYKDTDNNVVLESGDITGYCKAMKIVNSKSEPAIKLRSTYTGGDVYVVLELRSTLDNGNYWLQEGAPVVRIRYVESNANNAEKTDCLYFDFFYDGLQKTPLYCIFTNEEFNLTSGEDYYIEFGAVNTTDNQGNTGFVFFVNVTQGDCSAYGECTMTGDYNVSDTGNVTIYISPAPTAQLLDYSNWKTNDVSDFVIKSVDTEREIDGQTVSIGAMSLYNPQIRRAEGYDEYDISDIVPIGNGVTYTNIENDTTSQSQSMINAIAVPTTNGGYTVKMKIKFTKDDFGCTFAFRGKSTHAQSGYKIIIADNVVIVGSVTRSSPFKPDTEYEIEIGCIDYYIADERVTSGTIVYLKVNGDLIVEDNIDKLTGLGTYFCGLVEGGEGSTVTITSTKAETDRKTLSIVTKSNKTVVAKDKKGTLSYESNMATAYDKVSYEVLSGDATINGDGLYSNTDSQIKIRVKVENEFGTFYGEEIVLNSNASSSGCSCKGVVSGDIIIIGFVLSIVAIIVTIYRRRKKI